MKHTTVLLTSTGEAQLLRRSLPAAIAQEGAEVVVVDNGCSDDTSSITSFNPARTKLDRATSACFSSISRVTTLPPDFNPRAIQIVLYPPSVPISSMERAPMICARRDSMSCNASSTRTATSAASARPGAELIR